MLQDISKCPNNLDVFEGQHSEGNTLVTLWCHYVCEIFDLPEFLVEVVDHFTQDRGGNRQSFLKKMDAVVHNHFCNYPLDGLD